MTVKKRYADGKMAVKGVSLGVPKGQCFGLLGPNGAGKTSTINMMCGMQKLTAGEIELCGFNLTTELKRSHGILGVCPQ